ncbi:MAG: DUF480 domain-containing protein [Planctomycetaceae bacterium]|nr:DUF480 domain-containing protein [Planctomycetaceae bacterium]
MSEEEAKNQIRQLTRLQRRVLGTLMEKGFTTPDQYPMTLKGATTGCNQKSNRHPLMNLQVEQVEEELEKLRAAGIVAEVQGGGRVPKYRHYGYDYLGVKGVEAAIMTELLLRGEQTAGELRTRAGRFEPIADLPTLQGLLDSLMARGLVVALTPPGRGQLFTHNLYLPEELERLPQQARQTQPANGGVDTPSGDRVAGNLAMGNQATSRSANISAAVGREQWDALQEEVNRLRQSVAQLSERLDRLES